MRLAQKAAPSGSGSSLSLSWALQELRKQLGGDGFSLDGHLAQRRPTGHAEARPGEGSSQQSGLSSATPTSSDAASGASARHAHSHSSSQGSAGARTGALLSVHWAEALEQHCARQHAPHHGHSTPDKPCLKSQQSSFPFVEEAAQLEGGLLRRPWAGAGGSGPDSSALPGKKRSRLAAFGQ